MLVESGTRLVVVGDVLKMVDVGDELDELVISSSHG